MPPSGDAPKMSLIDPILIEKYIKDKFSHAPKAGTHYASAWIQFYENNFADRHFIKELMSSDEGKFLQRIWEIFLGCRLVSIGHQVSAGGNGHPDFVLEHDGKKIWVEAISPLPKNIPIHWLAKIPTIEELQQHPEFYNGSIPFNEILLCYTAAVKEKYEKLEGCAKKNTQGYHKKQIVGENDAYIIAIDSYQLIPNGMQDEGISQWPLIVEALFPIGPIAIPIDRNSGKMGQAYQSLRFKIHNRNNATIYTDNFLNPAYSGVSAVIARSTYAFPNEHLIVVHNPHADVKLPVRLFGEKSIDYVAEDLGNNEYELKKVTNAAN